MSRQDKPKHKRVKATYFDRNTAKRKEVESDASEDGPDYLLREPYQGEDEAKEAAKPGSRPQAGRGKGDLRDRRQPARPG